MYCRAYPFTTIPCFRMNKLFSLKNYCCQLRFLYNIGFLQKKMEGIVKNKHYRVNFVWRRSKSEAWLKFGRVTRNFALYKKLLMRFFFLKGKRSPDWKTRTWKGLQSITGVHCHPRPLWFDLIWNNNIHILSEGDLNKGYRCKLGIAMLKVEGFL